MCIRDSCVALEVIVGNGAGLGVGIGADVGVGATETGGGATEADPPLPPPQASKLKAIRMTKIKWLIFIKRSAQ